MKSELHGLHDLAVEQARDRISYLGTLPPGWNTYGSPPISERAIQAAQRLLETVHSQGAPLPQIVPTSDGGIQFEWHVTGRRLEIEIDDAGAMEYFFVDAADEVEGSIAGTQDPTTCELLDRVQ